MKKFVGAIGIICGILFLSIEIYSLRVLQALERISGSWRINVWMYACEPPCTVALILTVGVVLFSIYLFYKKDD